jgi:hypothetical protein
MGSFQPPKHAYSPEDLNQLEWLFDSVWTMFKAQHPTRDEVADEERKTTLRQTLFALVCRGGLGDEDELRARLLASVGPREVLGRSIRSPRPRKLERSTP